MSEQGMPERIVINPAVMTGKTDHSRHASDSGIYFGIAGAWGKR